MKNVVTKTSKQYYKNNKQNKDRCLNCSQTKKRDYSEKSIICKS